MSNGICNRSENNSPPSEKRLITEYQNNIREPLLDKNDNDCSHAGEENVTDPTNDTLKTPNLISVASEEKRPEDNVSLCYDHKKNNTGIQILGRKCPPFGF